MLVVVLTSSVVTIAQTIDTEQVSITLNGDASTVTLKSVSSVRAINELCEQGIQSKVSSVLVPGVWEVAYDGTGYTPKKQGNPLEGSPFKAKADAVKAMKLAMKAYYTANGTLAAK